MATPDVQEIQNRISALVDQSSDSPTAGGDEWDLRLKYLNMAQREWAELYNWRALYKEYNTLTSTGSANASVTLPSDFRKIASYPKIDGDDFSEIRPEAKSQYDSTDEYFFIIGNPADNYTMIFNPSDLSSGTSIYVPYYASPASLVSPADKSMCPDPDFLTQRSVALLWEAREDGRFPQAKAEADKRLARMLEMENTHTDASQDSRIQTELEYKYGFRIGRD